MSHSPGLIVHRSISSGRTQWCRRCATIRRITKEKPMADGGLTSGIGAPVRRREDLGLLTGQGRYSDDLTLPGQAYAVMLRSPHAHAEIGQIDTNQARAVPGV